MADSIDWRIPRELLPLAAHDLRDAAQAAVWLAAMRGRKRTPSQAMLYFARAVETGMVVSYWRPFSEHNKLGKSDEKRSYLSRTKYVPRHHWELHKLVGQLRNRVYAHVDKHPARNVKYEPGSITVESAFFPPDRLDEMVAMCRAVIEQLDAQAMFREMLHPGGAVPVSTQRR